MTPQTPHTEPLSEQELAEWKGEIQRGNRPIDPSTVLRLIGMVEQLQKERQAEVGTYPSTEDFTSASS